MRGVPPLTGMLRPRPLPRRPPTRCSRPSAERGGSTISQKGATCSAASPASRRSACPLGRAGRSSLAVKPRSPACLQPAGSSPPHLNPRCPLRKRARSARHRTVALPVACAGVGALAALTATLSSTWSSLARRTRERRQERPPLRRVPVGTAFSPTPERSAGTSSKP